MLMFSSSCLDGCEGGGGGVSVVVHRGVVFFFFSQGQPASRCCKKKRVTVLRVWSGKPSRASCAGVSLHTDDRSPAVSCSRVRYCRCAACFGVEHSLARAILAAAHAPDTKGEEEECVFFLSFFWEVVMVMVNTDHRKSFAAGKKRGKVEKKKMKRHFVSQASGRPT